MNLAILMKMEDNPPKDSCSPAPIIRLSDNQPKESCCQLKESCESNSNEINLNSAVNTGLCDTDVKSQEQISANKSTEKTDRISKDWVKYAISGFSGIVIGIVVVSPTLLIPQHYIMVYPEFWYEFTLLSSFGWCGALSAVMILNFSCWIDVKEVKSWEFFIILYAAVLLALYH